jgi:hypothetical protein
MDPAQHNTMISYIYTVLYYLFQKNISASNITSYYGSNTIGVTVERETNRKENSFESHHITR